MPIRGQRWLYGSKEMVTMVVFSKRLLLFPQGARYHYGGQVLFMVTQLGISP